MCWWRASSPETTTARRLERREERGDDHHPMVAGGLPRLELYGTVAQAYRPATYGELVPTSATGSGQRRP